MSPSRYGPSLLTPPSMSSLPTNQLLHHSQITSLTNSMVHHHTAMTNGLNGLTNNNSLNTNNNHRSDHHVSGNNVKSMVSSNNSSSDSIPPSSPNNLTRSVTPGELMFAWIIDEIFQNSTLQLPIKNNLEMHEEVLAQLVQLVLINVLTTMVSLAIAAFFT